MEQPYPIPFTADIVFKYVFGHRESTGILRSLLSAVQTDAGFPAVAEVTIENPFNLQETVTDKLSVVDVRAIDVTGRIFTVEVQSWNEPAFLKRALYYWARGHATQLEANREWRELCQTVGVNIMDFDYYRERPALHTTFMLAATDDPTLCMTEDLVIHTVELPKLLSATEEERERYLSTEIGRWSYVLGRGRTEMLTANEEAMMDIFRESPDIQAAEERYRRFLADPQLQSMYRAREKGRMDQESREGYARREGLAAGKAEGKAEGRRETLITTVRRMKELGAETSFIVAATGLTEAEIRET
jgi:predicted transposase/invertase (TIGR01784 family)